MSRLSAGILPEAPAAGSRRENDGIATEGKLSTFLSRRELNSWGAFMRSGKTYGKAQRE